MEATTRAAIRTGLRLAFAHHPLCGYFRADVFGRRLPVCSGCALAWPVFFVVLVVAVRGPAYWGWEPWWMAGAGLLLGVPQGSTLLWRGGRVWRGVVKAVGGAGLAMLLAGGLWLPVPLGWKVAAGGVLLLAMLAFLALRMRSILRTCDACPWRRDWEHCPGFGLHGDRWERMPRIDAAP